MAFPFSPCWGILNALLRAWGGGVDYWRWSLLVEGGRVSKSFDNVTLSFSMKTVVFLLIPEAYISFVTSL